MSTALPSNLPANLINVDSNDKVRSFFDSYFIRPLTYPAAEIDAVVGFFRKRGFDELSSNSTAIILLQQAKLDNVNVFTLLDTLDGLESIQLSAVVAEVLNYNRQKISTLGYRRVDPSDLLEKRNIIDNVPIVQTGTFDAEISSFDNNELTFDRETI